MIFILKYFLTYKNMSKTCNICVEDVDITFIKKCPYCDFDCCINCHKKYLLDTKKTEKSCMSCKKVFTRSILINIFGVKYIEDIYKNHIKELLFKEEMLLVPLSLPIIERNIEKKKMREIIKSMETEFQQKIKNNTLERNTVEAFAELGKIQGYKNYLTYLSTVVDIKEKKIYKFPCSNNTCNGFVNKNWKCELCDKVTCKRCNILINDGDEHICKKEDIETAELIKKDSKPCPKCNMSIIKSSGCDQMWCVSCHTTFDWKTLEIKKGGVIHNPEYFRYMRENGINIERNPLDNPCANDFQNSLRVLTNINKIWTKDKKYSTSITAEVMRSLFELYRKIGHFELVQIADAQNKINRSDNWKNDQRVRFLEKVISEKQYKTNLAKKFKEIEFLNEVTSLQTTILETSKATFVDIVNNLDADIQNAYKNKKRIESIDKYNKLYEFITELQSNGNTITKIYNLMCASYLKI